MMFSIQSDLEHAVVIQCCETRSCVANLSFSFSTDKVLESLWTPGVQVVWTWLIKADALSDSCSFWHQRLNVFFSREVIC